jgi:hypothetical protein
MLLEINYLCSKIAANGDVVADKTNNERFDVFRTSFQRRFSQNDQPTAILLVHNSRSYVRSYGEGPASCIEVYNILTLDISSAPYGIRLRV